MKRRDQFVMAILIVLLLPVISVYSQVNKKYRFIYDESGNREKREVVLTTQNINLLAGWNIVSANILPEVRDIKPIFQPLINSGELLKVSDEAGKTLENWGIFGGWVNQIGDIQATEGYKVNVNANCVLSITGDEIALPLDIPLTGGWNIISFPQTTEVNAMDVVQPLLGAGTLLKVQDESGNSIEDWGVFGGWKNNIGNFKPGEGYKVSVTSNTQLTINLNYTKSAVIERLADKPQHFSPVYKGKGVDHMNINIVNVPGFVEEGDEISAYDGKMNVGAIKVTGEHVKNQRIELIVSAADEIGSLGFLKGNQIKLKLWKKAADEEFRIKVETIKGKTSFDKHESAFIRLKDIEKDEEKEYAAFKTEEPGLLADNEQTAITTRQLTEEARAFSEKPVENSLPASFRCYPNPLTDELTIEFYIPLPELVTVAIYNSTGQLIRTIVNGSEQPGMKMYKWDRKNENGLKVSPGLYVCKIKVNTQHFDQKLIVK